MNKIVFLIIEGVIKSLLGATLKFEFAISTTSRTMPLYKKDVTFYDDIPLSIYLAPIFLLLKKKKIKSMP